VSRDWKIPLTSPTIGPRWEREGYVIISCF
jgi:hypothetical protein